MKDNSKKTLARTSFIIGAVCFSVGAVCFSTLGILALIATQLSMSALFFVCAALNLLSAILFYRALKRSKTV